MLKDGIVEYLRFAGDLAHAAGDVLRHYASRDKHIEFKGRANLVTVADRESEALIIGRIQRQYPEHGILAEESGLVSASGASTGGARWVIDPLDGTTNYAHQFPMYCVSIGFEMDGVLECGVVYDPVRDEMFRAARGQGAWINKRRLRVSGVARLAEGLLLTGFPYGFRDQPQESLKLFEKFLVASQAVRRSGSAALDLCYLASGRSDGFWELDLNPWDTAAGTLILRESGGRVSDFQGKEFSIEGKAILASNEIIHPEMLRIVCDPQDTAD